MKKILLPPALKPGDTIAIMAPSSRTAPEAIAPGAARLQGLGYTVFIHRQSYAAHGSSAGTDEEKLAAFHELFANPAVRAIVATRGGYHADKLLRSLDYDLIRENPKILMGFSDLTAISNTVYKDTGLVNFHGPMAFNLDRLVDRQLGQCLDLLAGRNANMPLTDSAIAKQGSATGPLIGGNLSVLTTLLGTPWQPDFNGALLFLEDCGDELSRIDRMLGHLANAGVFRAVAGVILGGFTDLTDTGRLPFGFTIEDIIAQRMAEVAGPVVMNAPFGHGADLYTLPIGAAATLTAAARGATLTLDGPAVAL